MSYPPLTSKDFEIIRPVKTWTGPSTVPQPAPVWQPSPSQARLAELLRDKDTTLPSIMETLAEEFPLQGAPLLLVHFLLKALFDDADAMNEKNIERNAKIADLQARVAELEAQPRGLDYQGTWDGTKSYSKQQVVTCGGSMWICKVDGATQRPNEQGDGARQWQLVVKKGRDGKDGRDAVDYR